MGVRYRFTLGNARLAIAYCIFFAIIFFPACAHFSADPAKNRLTQGEHTAIINGAKLHYHIHGAGPLCIVQPGGPGIGWDYLRMPSLEKRLTLVYLEPVGSGASETLENPKDYTFKRYEDDIEGLRQYLGLDRIFLMGHSHGGMVAQVYAINHPGNLRGLILLATTPVSGKEWLDDLSANLGRYANEPWFNEALPSFTRMGASKTSDEAMGLFKKAAGFYFADYAANKKRVDAAMAKIRCNLPPYQAFLGQQFDVRGQLHLINAPTLVIGGRKDPIFSVRFAGQIHDAIPRSRLAVLEQSGHMAHFDQPERLAETVAGFVMDVDKTQDGK